MPEDLQQSGVAGGGGGQDESGPGPGQGPVPALGIIFVAAYHVAAIIFCLYGLIVFWPVPTPSGGQEANKPSNQQTVSTTGPSDSPTPVRSPQRFAVATPSPTAMAEPLSPSPESTPPVVSVPLTSPKPSPSPGGTTTPTPTGTPPPTPGSAEAFGREFKVWDEVRLLWIVMLAGALGSLIHALRSVYWYVGNRQFVWSWIGKYLVLPFSGSALAVVFYLVIRGGFFSPQAGPANTSPFGFAAMAALVGLFSEQAVLKLQQVAETVFTKPPPGANAVPQTPVAKSIKQP